MESWSENSDLICTAIAVGSVVIGVVFLVNGQIFNAILFGLIGLVAGGGAVSEFRRHY